MMLFSSLHDMRRRPHGYKKAEHMTCNADQEGINGSQYVFNHQIKTIKQQF